MRQSTIPAVGDLSRRLSRAIKVRLFMDGSSIPKLVDAMPVDSLGRSYSYRAVARKLSGDARMTLDDLEAICIGLGIEPHALVASACRAESGEVAA